MVRSKGNFLEENLSPYDDSYTKEHNPFVRELYTHDGIICEF